MMSTNGFPKVESASKISKKWARKPYIQGQKPAHNIYIDDKKTAKKSGKTPRTLF